MSDDAGPQAMMHFLASELIAARRLASQLEAEAIKAAADGILDVQALVIGELVRSLETLMRAFEMLPCVKLYYAAKGAPAAEPPAVH
jgi:hypothetical protein